MATAPPEVSNADLARRAFDLLNERDLAGMKEFWTDATVERFPDKTCNGTDEIAAYFEDTFAAIPDWHMDVVAVAEQGDDVFVHWHLTGTHARRLMGIEATGKAISIDGMDHFVFHDGKVASNFVIADQLQYARQIGMMPPDGSAADKVLKTGFNAVTKLVQKLKR